MADWKCTKGRISCREEHVSLRVRHFVVTIGDVTRRYENEDFVHRGRNPSKEAGDMYSQFMTRIISENRAYVDPGYNRPGITLPAPIFPKKLKSRITNFNLLE